MSVFTTLAADLDAEWQSVEPVIDADALIFWDAFKALFSTVLPSQAAIIVQVIKDNIATYLTDPAIAETNALTELAAKELAWWDAMEASLQSTILNAFAAVMVVPAPTTAPTA